MKMTIDHIPTGCIFWIPFGSASINQKQDPRPAPIIIRDTIENWCKDNCVSQWSVFQVSKGSLYAPTSQKSPISKKEFSMPRIHVDGGFILLFENEEEATAFKLSFTEAN